jgi:hypothetical protein
MPIEYFVDLALNIYSCWSRYSWSRKGFHVCLLARQESNVYNGLRTSGSVEPSITIPAYLNWITIVLLIMTCQVLL